MALRKVTCMNVFQPLTCTLSLMGLMLYARLSHSLISIKLPFSIFGIYEYTSMLIWSDGNFFPVKNCRVSGFVISWRYITRVHNFCVLNHHLQELVFFFKLEQPTLMIYDYSVSHRKLPF